MKVLGVVGAPDAAAKLVERLGSRLTEEGRVATVTRQASDVTAADVPVAVPELPADSTSIAIDPGGTWVAHGAPSSLDEVLDSLAADHEYVLVSGFQEATIPTVALGPTDAVDEDAVVVADDPSDVDLEAVVEFVADTEPFETLSSLVERVKRSPDSDRAGAIATFTGRVRARDDANDPRTEFLEFEKYEGVADDRMDAIADELSSREGVYEVELYHRTGVVETGEDIVFVVVLAGHRAEAFRTVEDGIDRLKDEVPLFKKEVTVEDEFWVHDEQ